MSDPKKTLKPDGTAPDVVSAPAAPEASAAVVLPAPAKRVLCPSTASPGRLSAGPYLVDKIYELPADIADDLIARKGFILATDEVS